MFALERKRVRVGNLIASFYYLQDLHCEDKARFFIAVHVGRVRNKI